MTDNNIDRDETLQTDLFAFRFAEYGEKLFNLMIEKPVFSHKTSEELVLSFLEQLFDGMNLITFEEVLEPDDRVIGLTVLNAYPQKQKGLFPVTNSLVGIHDLSPGNKYLEEINREVPCPYISCSESLILELETEPMNGLYAMLFRPPYCVDGIESLSCLLLWAPQTRKNQPCWDANLLQFTFMSARIALLYGHYHNWQLAERLGGEEILFTEGGKLIKVCMAKPEIPAPFYVVFKHLELLLSRVENRIITKDKFIHVKRQLSAFRRWETHFEKLNGSKGKEMIEVSIQWLEAKMSELSK